MSQLPSKFETLLESARTEAIQPPTQGPAEALAMLRTTARRRPSARPLRWIASGGVVAAATMGVLMWPRPSEAARLLKILQQPYLGVVKQERTTVWNGERSSSTIFWDGTVAREIAGNGSETRFEPERILTRYPEGYVQIRRSSRPNAATIVQPLDIPRLLNTPGASIQRSITSAGEKFDVRGRLIDGQGINRGYRVTVQTDASRRPVLESIHWEGLGETRIELSYGHPPTSLELTPVPNDRVFDIDSQRRNLLARMETPNLVGTIDSIAIRDQLGNLAVILPAEPSIIKAGEIMLLNGEPRRVQPSVMYEGVELAGQEVFAPHTFRGTPFWIHTFPNSEKVDAPFEIVFPFWTPKYRRELSHPLFDPSKAIEPRLIKRRKVVVKSIEETSSIYSLLAPENVPFFADKVQRQKSGETSATNK